MRVFWIAIAAVAGVVAGNVLPNWAAVVLAAAILIAASTYEVQRRRRIKDRKRSR